VTFQQVQKYEVGASRISVSLLWDMARALGCEIGTLIGVGTDASVPSVDPELAVIPGALELMELYGVSNEGERSALLGAARAMVARRRRG